MSFDFVENFTVKLPDFSEYEAEFSESFNSNKALIIEVAAIHEGLTSNYNFYSKEDLEKSLVSWVEPYPKPIILNHDLNSEPFGRVMAAKMDDEDGSSFVRLQIAITDPVAAQKVMDKRYLTGSVGGRAGKAICSISGEDLANESAPRPGISRYTRGKVYKGKLAYIKMEDISFKEYSFVNQPADQKSGVRKINSQDPENSISNSEDWVAKSSAFILHMDKEEIISVQENESVLKNLKKKEAHPTYLSLKGAFLTALAVHESETDNKTTESLLYDDSSEKVKSQEKKDMAKASKEEDILAVANGLSEDLSTIAASSNSVTEEEGTTEAEEESSEEDAQVETTVDEESAEVSQDEETSGKSEEADVQSEIVDSEKAEESKADSEETAEESINDKEAESKESEGEVVAALEDELITNNSSNELSQELEDLKSRITTLENENTQLKKALHRTLVERVVDVKISSGLESISERESLIEEHSARTPSSLADTLRDLAKMPVATKVHSDMPELASETEVISSEKNVYTIGTEEVKEPAKEDLFEQILVDALMGRRKL
jgi:hypothetical protein